MDTKVFDVREIINDKQALETALRNAADMLAYGGTVAFPTETVYGLGANAFDEAAVKKVFEAKGRPSDNPLIIHIADMSQLKGLVKSVPERALRLMESFWPGPLSIIMEKEDRIPDCVTAGLGTAAVRMPENPEAYVLLKLAGCPVAAPSANLSGKPSPTKPEHVLHDLDGRVSGIVLGRTCDVGIESTVIDMSTDSPVILRPGIIIKEDIEAVIGPVRLASRKNSSESVPKAPGMKYTHYAPDAPMILFEGSPSEMLSKILGRASEELASGKKVGIIATDETLDLYEKSPVLSGAGSICILSTGSRKDLKTVAHNIFHILRRFDEENVDIILSEAFEAEGIGFSVMNRMDKAAGEKK
ncbi:MAG: L-threonylcarbamoyladenylate synthase [Bacillota bacterium]|nr:L-threonylcarbamoyladenylate synthase [Bacillota bacterium]